MNEIINTYLLDDPETVVPMNREEFYREQVEASRKDGKPTRANEIIDIFLFNSRQELIVQKRAFNKTHNPGLLDKSIGGHVRYGDTADYSVWWKPYRNYRLPRLF